MSPSLDKANPIPIYLQLAALLEEQIASGALPVGASLPSENSLAEHHALNRNTIRHAIDLLVDKGLVEKQKGVGTFVHRRKTLYPIRQFGRMTSFVDDFALQDVEIEDEILAQEKVKASPDLAAKLGAGVGEPLVLIERLRIADRIPFVLERQFYTYRDFGRLHQIDIRGSMYQLLVREFHADLHHSIQTLRAVRPGRDIAQKLHVTPGTPCMFLEGLAYTSQDQCIEVLQSYYRGDRYLFRVETGEYRRDMDPGVSS